MILTLWLMIFALQGCYTTHNAFVSLPLTDWHGVRNYISIKQPPLSFFEQDGPFQVAVTTDFKIPISIETTLPTDYFRPKQDSPSPLLVFVHGNGFNKSVHFQQAKRLASWGFQCLTVEVPNRDEWIQNGRRIAQLTKLIHSYPRLLSDNIDTSKIILIGHSFGGSAVTIAAFRGAPVSGLILLDPAIVHNSLKTKMTKVQIPAILLGADRSVFLSRKREFFYQYFAGPLAELSIADATHNDAQSPSIDKLNWGFDFSTSHELQDRFITLMTASAFSLAGFGNIKFAWQLTKQWSNDGLIKNRRIRFSQPQNKVHSF